MLTRRIACLWTCSMAWRRLEESIPATNDPLDRLDAGHGLNLREVLREKILKCAERDLTTDGREEPLTAGSHDAAPEHSGRPQNHLFVRLAPLATPLASHVSECDILCDIRHLCKRCIHVASTKPGIMRGTARSYRRKQLQQKSIRNPI